MARKKLEWVFKGTEVDGVYYPANLTFTEVPENIGDYLPDELKKAIAEAFIANFEMHKKPKEA